MDTKDRNNIKNTEIPKENIKLNIDHPIIFVGILSLYENSKVDFFSIYDFFIVVSLFST